VCELFADKGSAPRIVAEYDYWDERGELLYQVVRFEGKAFRQRRPDGRGGWVWKLGDVRRVLYRLSEVLGTDEVPVCEGEKDCEAARSLGLVATCNPGGAGKWRDEYSELLRGKRVPIIADADGPGRKHAQQVAESLHGKAASVKVLELPGAKDLSEWVERGGTREKLLELMRSAPEWNPQTGAPAQQGSRIVLASAEEFLSRSSVNDRPWVAEGLLPAGSQTIWQGRPKVGKSHTLLQFAFDAACGLAVFGQFSVARPIRVSYVELEEPEPITKERFAGMLRAHNGQGPDASNLRFFTREDLQRFKIPSRELVGARLKDFASALSDSGVELVFLIAARRLVYGNLKDPEIAERLNDALDFLAQETGAAIALVHHSRKESADTLEAQGIGSTFVSAHADATFDISRTADGCRKVGREGRYGEETFFLRKISEGDGELIRVSDPPVDSRAVSREELLRRVAGGESVYQAAKATGVPYPTAKRWASEAQRN
jgi:5S rRNA maturation endonuclease (ribonuclease M5)